MTAAVFYLRFAYKKQFMKDTYAFYFDMTGENFAFTPGQYIQITLPHEDADERGTSRFFTISSSPTEKDFLMITSRKGTSSFKKALFRLKEGAQVQIFGPIGTFVLPEV